MARQPRQIAGIGASDIPNIAAARTYIGPAREVISDGTTLRLQDGITPGGIPLLASGNVTLLAAAASTGSWKAWPGGTAAWSVSGVWGGATAQLQASADGGTTPDAVTGAVATSNTTLSQFIGDFPASYVYRVLLTGASGSTSLTSTLKTLDRV